jgi:hypothetical protein
VPDAKSRGVGGSRGMVFGRIFKRATIEFEGVVLF